MSEIDKKEQDSKQKPVKSNKLWQCCSSLAQKNWRIYLAQKYTVRRSKHTFCYRMISYQQSVVYKNLAEYLDKLVLWEIWVG